MLLNIIEQRSAIADTYAAFYNCQLERSNIVSWVLVLHFPFVIVLTWQSIWFCVFFKTTKRPAFAPTSKCSILLITTVDYGWAADSFNRVTKCSRLVYQCGTLLITTLNCGWVGASSNRLTKNSRLPLLGMHIGNQLHVHGTLNRRKYTGMAKLMSAYNFAISSTSEWNSDTIILSKLHKT